MAIVVGPEGGMWVSGVDDAGEPIKLPNSVAGDAIAEKLNTFDLVLITVMNPFGDRKVLPFPAYALNTDATMLSIDIGEILEGTILEIALPSGSITIKGRT